MVRRQTNMSYRMAAALALVAGTSGCVIYIDDPNDGDGPIVVDPGYPTDPDYPYPEPPEPPNDCLLEAPRILDCNKEAGYEVSSYWSPYFEGETRLHMLGVYETAYGKGYVYFDYPGSNILALSAYEATEWVIELSPEASLDKIVVVGHEAQTVYGPEGVPVEIYTYDQGSELYGCGYAYPSDGGGCDTEALIAMVESITNVPLMVFEGCYEASTLQITTADACDPPPPPCSEDQTILDCDISAGYEVSSYRADNDSETALHLVGVYETYEYEASVYFDQSGSNVLALSAYTSTQWNVELAPGASLDKIVAVGYEAQFVKGPEGVPVEIYTYEGQDSELAGCGYSLPYDGGGCDTDQLIATVESITGLTLSRFDGCYRASAIQVGSKTCEPPPPPPPAPPSSVILDCADQSYSSRSETNGRPAVYLGAVYETRSDHEYGYHPTGEAYVEFTLPGENVLALSAYEPTHWVVEVTPGASLQKVVLIGYHTQTADVPEGVALEVHDYESTDSPLAACGYSLPYNGGGCDTDQLIANVETITGLPVTGFDGCYNATTFAYY
jgi:hypothetical protein